METEEIITTTGVQTPVTKTLRELAHISSALGNGSHLNVQDNSSRNRNRSANAVLLSRHGIHVDDGPNPLEFSFSSSSVVTAAAAATGGSKVQTLARDVQKFSGGEAKDLDAYLMHHHELILATTLAESASKREYLADQLNECMQEDWEQEREDLLMGDIAGFERVRGLVHSVAGGVGIGDSGGDYLLESHSYQSSLQQQQQQGNRYGGGNGLSDVAKKHVLLVAKFNRNDASRNGQVSSSSMTSFCAEFEAVAESVKDGTYAAGKYLDTWRLLGDMLQYDTTDASLSAEQKVTLRARGALSYLCSQFKEMVVKRSRKMALSDSNERGTRSNGIPGSLVDDVATYVRSEIGISRSGGFLWPCVYLCKSYTLYCIALHFSDWLNSILC